MDINDDVIYWWYILNKYIDQFVKVEYKPKIKIKEIVNDIKKVLEKYVNDLKKNHINLKFEWPF